MLMTENEEPKSLTADLMREIAVDAEGAPLVDQQVTDDNWTWNWNRIGRVNFQIVDAAADDLARDLGAIGQSDDPASELPRLCLRAFIDVPDGQPQPRMGDTLVLQAEGVPLLFTWWMGHDDANAPIPADSSSDNDSDDWVRNPALASLQPGEALLVQTHQLSGADGTVILQ